MCIRDRSQTVLATDDDDAKGDRVGLIFFIAGLGALVGAVAYAVWLWQASQSPMIEVQLTTTPPGAKIILDGADTGAKTPHTFRNIEGNRPHSIEFRRDGYTPCVRALAVTDQSSATVECKLDEKR